MALAQGLCLASGTAEICCALRNIIYEALAQCSPCLRHSPCQSGGAVSRQGSPRRGLVPWALAHGAVLPVLRMVVADSTSRTLGCCSPDAFTLSHRQGRVSVMLGCVSLSTLCDGSQGCFLPEQPLTVPRVYNFQSILNICAYLYMLCMYCFRLLPFCVFMSKPHIKCFYF